MIEAKNPLKIRNS